MSRTILVVEDYDDVRHLMKLLLESYGYQVTEQQMV
jgi:CheY-like chemotaxis protein